MLSRLLLDASLLFLDLTISNGGAGLDGIGFLPEASMIVTHVFLVTVGAFEHELAVVFYFVGGLFVVGVGVIEDVLGFVSRIRATRMECHYENDSRAFRYDGAEWMECSEGPADDDDHGIWSDNPGELYAYGERGRIWRVTASSD